MHPTVFLVIAVIASAGAVSPNFANRVGTAMQQCESQNNLPNGTIANTLNSSVRPTSNDVGCALGCFFTAFGVVNNGQFVPHMCLVFHRKIYRDPEVVRAAYGMSLQCIYDVSPEGRNECTFARDGYFCVVDRLAQAGLPPMNVTRLLHN